MVDRGLSWPSMTFCCRPVKTSLKLMETGWAPRASNTARRRSEVVVRNLMPFMSSGVLMGRTLLVM